MNKPKCNEYDYINFLIATQKAYTCTEAAKVQPLRQEAPYHDSLNRLLYRSDSSTEALWKEAKEHVNLNEGVLILDDSTLDKAYASKIEYVTWHWSGKHHRVVKGINLQTLLWTDGDSHIPLDYRIYHTTSATKNEHFMDLLEGARKRGFKPKFVCFDSWYASLDNLKKIKNLGWKWFTQLKSNRQVDPDHTGNRPLSEVELTAQGRMVHLKGYGMIKVFKLVSQNGGIDYFATNDLGMDELKWLTVKEKYWAIENYHKAIKQYCGVEKCQARLGIAQHNHIGFAIRAFLRIERFSFKTGISWFEAKIQIVREAVRNYLTNPYYQNYLTA
jgi:putative transposase